MTKRDQLFIRACKSRVPYRRVKSVYKRFYAIDVPEDRHIAGVLSEVFDRNCPIEMGVVYWKFHPGNQFSIMNDEDQTYTEKFINFLISNIRYKDADSFLGLTSPARFRKKEDK